MNKKLIFSAIFWFLLINFFAIKDFSNNVLWKNFYDKWNFSESEKFFKSVKNFDWVYNLANIFYKQKKILRCNSWVQKHFTKWKK